MRETRLSGSEGGGAEANRLSLPPILWPVNRPVRFVAPLQRGDDESRLEPRTRRRERRRGATLERLMSLPTHRIQTPRPRAGGGEIEKEETVEDGGRALIHDRPEAVGEVADEVSERHLTGQEKGH